MACALSRQRVEKLVKLFHEGKSERFNNDIAEEGVKTQLTSNLLNESFYTTPLKALRSIELKA